MSRNSIIDIKRYSGVTQEIINATLLKKHGVECFFEKASEAIGFGATRSEIIEALKKDVTKTAEALVRAQSIIYSIENGVVKEFNSMFNSVEEVFGKAYDVNQNTITLSGICFDLVDKKFCDKSELAEKIYANIFDIDKKELETISKAVSIYDSETSLLKRAILSPCLEPADKIIAKIVGYDIAFGEFRKAQSYEERKEFDISYNRTGLDGVIQHASYVDEIGIRQLCKSHRFPEVEALSMLLRSGKLKYVQACEIDGDGDVGKAIKVVRQIERLIINTRTKFTLKFRKLGNFKALGICMPTRDIVAEDVRETSALFHEIAHHVHLHDLKDNSFVNYMIDKLKTRVNLPKHEEIPFAKYEYYQDPIEVLARALEIASLFAKEAGEMFEEEDDFNLIKSRAHYSLMCGVYFDFEEFDDDTVQEMLMLYKLFYQTSPTDVFNSEVDNFVKIDTNYRRTEKTDIEVILKRADKQDEKERRALFSMVEYANIETIIKNKGQISLQELTTTIYANIAYCGNHKKSMSVSDWAVLVEDKASTVLHLFDALDKELYDTEFFAYLCEIKKIGVIRRISQSVLVEGFKAADSIKIIREIKRNGSPNFLKLLHLIKNLLGIHPVLFFKDKALSKDRTLMAEIVKESPMVLKYLEQLGYGVNEILEYSKTYWELSKSIYGLIIVPECLKGDAVAMLQFIELAKPLGIEQYVTTQLRDSAEFMRKAIALGIDFKKCGPTLLSDVEFCEPYIKESPSLLMHVSKKVRDAFSNPTKKQTAKRVKPKQEEKKEVENISHNISFEELLKEAEVFDFVDTRNGEAKKGMRVKRSLSKDDFRSFLQYLRDNDIVTSYSPFIKGFIVKDINKLMVA